MGQREPGWEGQDASAEAGVLSAGPGRLRGGICFLLAIVPSIPPEEVKWCWLPEAELPGLRMEDGTSINTSQIGLRTKCSF